VIALFECIFIVITIIYVLRNGEGKERLWALAPIGIILVGILIMIIVCGLIYGFDNIKALRNSPLYIVFSIIGAVIIIGSCLRVIRHIQHKKALRAVESIQTDKKLNKIV